MKRIVWLSLSLFLVACGSQATPTLDVASRDATSVAWQMATIEARDAMATPAPTIAIVTSSAAAAATLTPQPSLVPLTPTPSQPFAHLVSGYDQVNVRNGPGTDYAILGQLQSGVSAPITGRNDDGTWWQINNDNAPGWVSGQLVVTTGDTATVPSQQVAPPQATPMQEPYVMVKASYDYVNIRSGPARSYEAVGRLQPNVSAPVIGVNSDGTWWQIEFEGAPRWIDNAYIDLHGNASSIARVAVPAPPQAASAQTAPAATAQTLAPAQTNGACPTTSNAHFDLIPRDGPANDRPDGLHGDLNLSLRGYSPVNAPTTLVDYQGGPDADGPQFMGMFQPRRAAAIVSVYRVNLWHFETQVCPGTLYGCAGGPDTHWPVSLVGLATTPGEPIAIPSRRAEIAPGYQVMVLYAEPTRITLNYTRQDNISYGYTVYLENVCVDPNLLALYRAQNDANGWRISTVLPALRNGQVLGSAMGNEIRVAIRDRASFMDPRARGDWWVR